MSSTLAYGPPIAVDGPLPVAPPHSLLTIPGVLSTPGMGHWMNGVGVWSYPVDIPETWDPCSTGTFRTKIEGSAIPSPLFGPFIAYLPITCSSVSIGDPDEFRDRATRVLEATESRAVEHALSQGVPLSSNPFFGDSDLTQWGGGAVTPEVGLRWLEYAIGRTGRQGLIHAPPEVVAAWAWTHLEEQDATLYTPNGTPVASGDGYQGADPVTKASPASGQSWAFATGPVQVMHAEVNVLQIADVLDRSNNDVTYRAERLVVASWDTALQAGVLIDWTP